MMQAPASLYVGRTVHQRETPFQRRFSYRIAMLDVDIDRLDAAARQARLFSVERANLMSFKLKDVGPRNGAALKPWALQRFADGDIDLEGGRVRLIAFPRVLGYSFAPISLWFGYGPEDDLRGVLYEVHNTFGEQHCYVAPTPETFRRVRQSVDKAFHVSPFFDIDGRYRFTLRPPEERLDLVIENLGEAGRTHTASLVARRRPLNDFHILRILAKMPLMAHGVTAGIHWEALKLWLRGVGYRSKPTPPAERTSVAELDPVGPRATTH